MKKLFLILFISMTQFLFAENEPYIKITVAKDGSGDFTSIQKAINSVRQHCDLILLSLADFANFADDYVEKICVICQICEKINIVCVKNSIAYEKNIINSLHFDDSISVCRK